MDAFLVTSEEGVRQEFGIVLRMVGRCVEDERSGSSDAVPVRKVIHGLRTSANDNRARENETHRRKKWKRSVTTRKDFLPVKNWFLALEISEFEEYLFRTIGSGLEKGSGSHRK